MIVPDTSAWIEYFRKTGHPAALRLQALIERHAEVGLTEVVWMELLAGAPSGAAADVIRSRLLGLPVLRLEGVEDFDHAASIYRACRDAGHALRGQADCLIAVPALRHGASILHNDRDFDVIARYTKLEIEAPAGEGGGEVRERSGRYRTKVSPRRRERAAGAGARSRARRGTRRAPR